MRVVIKVKGEDKGGYGSAQMNFQVGIGQVSSRMSDPAAAYAIAFPVTSNFVRVLRAFRGSLAFERLGLVMYAVGWDGSVRECAGGSLPRRACVNRELASRIAVTAVFSRCEPRVRR